MKNRLEFKDLVIVAMFSALTCAGTFIQIRMPAGDFVHLGNFVMIISALLLGGLKGGIIGSLGMGIYDLVFYINKPTTIIRTFVLKFLVGFLVGFIFNLIIKRKTKTTPLLYGTSALFGILFTVSMIMFSLGDFSKFGASNNFSSVYYNIFGSEKSFSVSLFIPVFSFIFGIGILIAAILSKKLSERSKAALFAITIALVVNIIGEFVLRFLLEGIMVSSFDVSIIVATSKIPGSLITGLISIILSTLIYEPIYKVLTNVGIVDKSDDNTDELPVEEL